MHKFLFKIKTSRGTLKSLASNMIMYVPLEIKCITVTSTDGLAKTTLPWVCVTSGLSVLFMLSEAGLSPLTVSEVVYSAMRD